MFILIIDPKKNIAVKDMSKTIKMVKELVKLMNYLLFANIASSYGGKPLAKGENTSISF